MSTGSGWSSRSGGASSRHTAARGIDAAEWVPVWIGFGPTWRFGDEPLPWEAHRALWQVLDGFARSVRFRRRLGGIRPLPVPEGVET